MGYKKPVAYPGYGGCAGCGSATYLLNDDDRLCPICRTKEGLPPLTTGPYIPWHTTMPPEEYAVIMSQKWITRPRWDGIAELPLTGRAVVEIDYPKTGKDGGTVRLMVGSVIPHAEHNAIFFHSYSQTGEGAQAHELTKSPCPVDTVVIEFLQAVGVRWYYGYDKDHETLWKATITLIADAPIAEYQAKTIRRRHFLPESSFTSNATGVIMRRAGAHHELIQTARSGQAEARLLRVPFVPKEETVILGVHGGN